MRLFSWNWLFQGTLAIPHTTEDKDLLHGMGIALGEKNQLHLGIDDIAEEVGGWSIINIVNIQWLRYILTDFPSGIT